MGGLSDLRFNFNSTILFRSLFCLCVISAAVVKTYSCIAGLAATTTGTVWRHTLGLKSLPSDPYRYWSCGGIVERCRVGPVTVGNSTLPRMVSLEQTCGGTSYVAPRRGHHPCGDRFCPKRVPPLKNRVFGIPPLGMPKQPILGILPKDLWATCSYGMRAD